MLTPKDLIALQGTIAEVFPGSVDAIRSVNVNDADELEIVFRSGTTLYRTVSGGEGMSEPQTIGEVEAPKQDSALYRYDGQDWVLDDPLLNLQGYPLRMDGGRSKPCPGGYRIPLTKKCRDLNALKKDLRHAGEHVGENVAAWSVGKVVGGAIAGVAASHGLNPDLSKQIAETGVQALTATLIHARKRENRQPGELARKFVSEAAGAFAGKMAHSGVDDAILGGDDHVKMLAAAMAGKTTGATVTPSVGSVLKRGESALNSILGRQRSDSIRYDATTGVSIQLTPEDQEVLFDLTFLGLLMAPTRADSVPDKYSHISFLPPQSVRSAFQSGLELHKKGVSGNGLEPATVREAASIAKGQSVTPEKVRKAVAWFGRNKRFARMPKDSPAWASWMLWGGDTGRKWFEKLGRLMDAADQKVRSDAADKKNKRNKKIAIALSEVNRTDAYPVFKKKLNIGGQTIGITHQAGDTRYDRPMLSHYGMVMGTYGQAEDGKAHDIYVEPGDTEGMCLYCIDQIDPSTRQLDERKYFLSKSVDRAKNLFILHVGPSRFGGIRKADWNEFGQQGDRTDAKKKAVSDDPPKPCGKGWTGTKPPGCKRASSGKTTKKATTKTTTKKTSTTKPKTTKKVVAAPSGSEVEMDYIPRETAFARKWEDSWSKAPKDLRATLKEIDEPEEIVNPSSHAYQTNGKLCMGGYDPNSVIGRAIYRHEYGHHLDDEMGAGIGELVLGAKSYFTPQKFLSSSDVFHAAFRKDEEKLLRSSASTDKGFEKIYDRHFKKYKDNPIIQTASKFGMSKARVGMEIKRLLLEDEIKAEAQRRVDEQVSKLSVKEKIELMASGKSLSLLGVRDEEKKVIQERIQNLGLAGKLYDRLPESFRSRSMAIETLIAENRPQAIARLADMAFFEGSGLTDDLIGSITTNKVGQGHLDEYYAARPIHAPNTEAFASLVTLYGTGDPLAIEVAKTLSPNGFKTMKKAFKGVQEAKKKNG